MQSSATLPLNYYCQSVPFHNNLGSLIPRQIASARDSLATYLLHRYRSSSKSPHDALLLKFIFALEFTTCTQRLAGRSREHSSRPHEDGAQRPKDVRHDQSNLPYLLDQIGDWLTRGQPLEALWSVLVQPNVCSTRTSVVNSGSEVRKLSPRLAGSWLSCQPHAHKYTHTPS